MSVKKMPTADLFAGVDHSSFDTRKFEPSPEDVQGICRFFGIGKLRNYEKEKGLLVSHSNFLVFVKTTRGRYALKFYPAGAAAEIVLEYAVNRILAEHHFRVPAMHKGVSGPPVAIANDRLAVCYSYIDGQPAWKHIREPQTLRKINGALLSLKDILSASSHRLPPLKLETLVSTINALSRHSRALAPYDQKDLIDASLLEACKAYRHHQALFTHGWLHNNAGLSNFLIKKQTVYTLDLSHVQPDYDLSDLSSMIISCIFFKIPEKTIDKIAENYFSQQASYLFRPQDKGWHSFPVLNTLVKIGLVKEYLKNVRRQRSLGSSAGPQALARAYTSQLSKRKKTIAAALKKIASRI